MDVHGVSYEAPMGIARMKSDESTTDNAPLAMGGFGAAPERDYDDMMDDEQAQNDAHERWICASCAYNNRPNHMHCKICKVKRTKFMKKVSEMDAMKKSPPKKKKQTHVEKIGGNAQNIPNRNYDALLTNTDVAMDGSKASIKPPFMQYNEQQNVSMAKK